MTTLYGDVLDPPQARPRRDRGERRRTIVAFLKGIAFAVITAAAINGVLPVCGRAPIGTWDTARADVITGQHAPTHAPSKGGKGKG